MVNTDPWWTRAVVYQVYPRSFADSDGDGVGDLRGITAHVDHLADLGVGAVWLSPVYRSPQHDNGYDISDYDAVDPLFGTLADVDELVGALHDRGIRLIMDLVVNHTSDAHPWFASSRSSRDDPYRDWYVWRPPRPGHDPGSPGAEPTNWGSFFSGPAWTFDEATGEYYLHLFARSQPDLNWENPQVRAAVHAMMNRWLDRGVDGFRMDVVNLISKDQSFPDGPVRGDDRVSAVGPDGLGDGSHAYAAGPRIHEFLAEMHEAVFAHRPGTYLTVGEMPGVTVEQARLFTDPARREVDMVFDFEHVGLDHGPGGKFDVRPLRLTDLKATLGRWQTGLADVGWTSLYWDNHDQPRIVSRWGDGTPASAKALATVLHLHRGTPFVYQGEEIGMTNAGYTSLDEYQDIESLRYAAAALGQGWADEDEVLAGLAAMSRDNARTPMQWDASEQAGFTTGSPSRPVNPNYVAINVAAQRDDPDSVLAHYRRLVALRRDDVTVALGRFAMLLPDDEHVYAFTRTWGEDRLVVVNLSARPRDADPGEDLTGATVVLTTHRDTVLDHPLLRLRPWEGLVLRPAATTGA